eukprot:Nk52_evm99s1073 gene=Nk52_evmTU99s1073
MALQFVDGVQGKEYNKLSLWPYVLTCLDLPPHNLRYNLGHMFLCGLDDGLKAKKKKDEKVNEYRNGVLVWDSALRVVRRVFVALAWQIADYPALMASLNLRMVPNCPRGCGNCMICAIVSKHFQGCFFLHHHELLPFIESTEKLRSEVGKKVFPKLSGEQLKQAVQCGAPETKSSKMYDAFDMEMVHDEQNAAKGRRLSKKRLSEIKTLFGINGADALHKLVSFDARQNSMHEYTMHILVNVI